MSVKERLTVTVDPELIRAGSEAVAAGRADSLSGWVNLALAERAAKERRLRQLAEAVAVYEAEFGILTPEEIARQERADRAGARIVRPVSRTASARGGRRRRERTQGRRGPA
jgi:hypothetical protein